jgi:hypothetical protein
MKKTIAIVLLAWTLAEGVQAQTRMRCTDDAFGNTTCRDSEGNVTRSHTDAFGNTITRDEDGNITRSHGDAYGGITVTRPDGSMVRGRADPYGGTTFRGPDGSRTRCHSSFGAPSLPGQTDIDCQ